MVKPGINLFFDGQCEAAFTFYEPCFGGKITSLLTWGDSAMAKDAPAEWSAKILHASLSVGDVVFGGADTLPPGYERPKGFAVLLDLSDPIEAERVYHALSENGTVTVPLQETFWAARYGWVKDRFGIPWTINCGKAE
jgi:PhnB protein